MWEGWTHIHIYPYIYVSIYVQMCIHQCPAFKIHRRNITKEGQFFRSKKHDLRWNQRLWLAVPSMRDTMNCVEESCLKKGTDTSCKWGGKGIFNSRLTLIISLCRCSALLHYYVRRHWGTKSAWLLQALGLTTGPQRAPLFSPVPC